MFYIHYYEMKRFLLSFFAMFLCVLSLSAEGTITLKTSKAKGEQLTIRAYCATAKESFTIDWGDGDAKFYFIDPNGWTYMQYARGNVKGDAITIKGDIVFFECTEAQLTSFTTSGMTKLENIDLSKNELTSFEATDLTALKQLNLKGNKLGTTDDGKFDITAAVPTLEVLNINDNNIGSMNLKACVNLTHFYANNNGDMGAVVFPDGSEKLETIELNNCGLSHFYPISLPNLKTLYMNNNYLMEQEEGGSYPSLQDLDVSHNYLTELYVTNFPKLERLDCSNNQLTVLNVSQNSALTSLKCASNNIKYLNTSRNTELVTLYCNDNKLSAIDLGKNSKISKLNVSDNEIETLNLENAFFLTELEASNTLCSWFNFNFVNPGGQFQYVDVRNNPNMTALSLNAMFKTMPQHYGYRSPSLLIDGSNYETANTDYITSNDAKWTVDKKGNGSAKDTEVNITVKADKAAEKVTYKGYFGGDMVNEQSVNMTRYTTTNGSFVIGQWSGNVLQKLANVDGKAQAGVPMFVMAKPAEGYQLKSITVNDKVMTDTCFIVNADANIEVTFAKADHVVAFTTTSGTYLSFELRAAEDGTQCSIDWGGGAPEPVTVNKGATYFDGAAMGTDLKIYGDVTYVDLGSFEGFGNENEISAIDVSGNNLITDLLVFMNPITTLDVSNLKNLKNLDCAYCKIEKLDLSHNTALQTLNCKGNKIATLDVTGCEGLTSLKAGNNMISEINLYHCPELEVVDVANNKLTELDVTNLPLLADLAVSDNDLTTLDVKQNEVLENLSVDNNKLTQLDLSANEMLRTLYFQNNMIQYLNLKNLTNLSTINCGGNGMSACDLDAFFAGLPERSGDLTGGTTQDVSLRLNYGEEARPNDAENSDTSIATSRNWTVNVPGNASGCPNAIIELVAAEGGTVVVTDEQGNVIKSGETVKKGTKVTFTAKPDFGYAFSGDMMVNGEMEFGVKTLTITKFTQIEPIFEADPTGIDDLNTNNVAVTTANGTISVKAAAGTKVAVVSTSGQQMAAKTLTDGTATFSVAAGAYIVKTTGAHGNGAVKVLVK